MSRRLFVVVLLALSGAGCASHGAKGETIFAAPPVSDRNPPTVPVSDRSTWLPCPPRPSTTVEIEGCMERAIAASDAAVNARIRKLFVLVDHSAGRRAVVRRAFVRGERAWLAYRNAECRGEAGAYITASSPHFYAGGTGAPLRFGWCQEELNAAHRRELASAISMLCELRHGSSSERKGCPPRR